MKTCKWCNFQDNYLTLKEYKYWTLNLAESQFILGWSHAVLKRHILVFEDLTNDELIELKQVITDLKEALDKTFAPDWFNVMQLGNMTRHLHFQLVPRYEKSREMYGRTFTDQDYGKMIIDRWKTEDKELLVKMVADLKLVMRKD